MKPKNFTELIQSNDYCENECEVGQDGVMSEAQHEACLGKVLNLNIKCYSTDTRHSYRTKKLRI